jgi:hypothetical protein
MMIFGEEYELDATRWRDRFFGDATVKRRLQAYDDADSLYNEGR